MLVMRPINVLIIFLLSTFSIVVQAETAKPPVINEVKVGQDLNSELSSYATKLKNFFRSEGANYSVAYGIGVMSVTNKSDSMYMQSVTDAYKQALIDAYIKLAIQNNPNGLDVITDDNGGLSAQKGNAFKSKVIKECREEALLAQSRKAKEDEEKAAEKESMWNALKERIRYGEQEKEANLKTETVQQDFIHICHKDGPSFSQASFRSESLEDVLSGGRVWASVLHGQQLGLVLLRSPDTSAIASVLKNQRKPSSINRAALNEVTEAIENEISDYGATIPYGVVGTRMKKLSNGEWSIYSYGAYQTLSEGGDFMSAVMMSSDASSAAEEARAELSRFSQLSLSKTSSNENIRAVEQSYKVEVNLTKDTSKVSLNEKTTMGAIINRVWSAQSDLQLVGSEEIFTRSFSDGPLKYYLSVVAWSPSIMAMNMGDRSLQEAAADAALRNPTSSKSTQSDQVTNGSSKVLIPNQDW